MTDSVATPVSKPLHTIVLNQQALARLDAILAISGWCPSTKTVLACRVWDKIRKAATRSFRPDGWDQDHDLDNPFPVIDGELQGALNKRVLAFNAAHKAWQVLPVTLSLSDKYRDTCRMAIEYAQKTPDKLTPAAELRHDQFTPLLLIAFGLADEISDE